MKELLSALEHVSLDSAQNIIFLDTCAFIYTCEHHQKLIELEKEALKKTFGLTSFNAEELIHIDHKISDKDREAVRKALKHLNLVIIDIPIHPGNAESERQFVENIHPDILQIIRDPSDAVLVATALKTKSHVVTRDKHHIYTEAAAKFAHDHNMRIFHKVSESIY
jgi:predicted nucleic acid-binding protein